MNAALIASLAAAGLLAGWPKRAGLAGVALVVSGRVGRKQHIPFGPVMISGAVLAVLAWPG